MKCCKCLEEDHRGLHIIRCGSVCVLCKRCEALYNELHPSIPFSHFIDEDKETKEELGIRLAKLRRKLHPNVDWSDREPIFVA